LSERVSDLFKRRTGSALDMICFKENELLRAYHEALLECSGGIRAEVARKAGAARSTARKPLKRFGLI
jgi:hypothetical protein